MIVALLGFLGLLGTAYIMSKPAAITANSYLNKLDERNFPFFVSSQLIVPFVFGTLFYLSFFLPRILFQEAYSWISLVLILIFIMGRISRMDTIYFDEEDRSTNLSLVIILVTVIIFVVLRVLLHNEIYISG